MSYSPFVMLVLLTMISFVNFLDRGIIPGASQEFNIFIAETLSINGEVSFYLGLLQSAFIGCYAIAAVIFGHLVHHKPPSLLISVGLSIWIIAIFLCGLSKRFDSYWMLLAARALSGVGEASFQCIAPPFIDDQAPPEKKAVWLAIFFTSIPVGTAAGYEFGSAIASSSLGWPAAYFLEGIIMVPFVFAMFFSKMTIRTKKFDTVATGNDALLANDALVVYDSERESDEMERSASDSMKKKSSSSNSRTKRSSSKTEEDDSIPPTMWMELVSVVTSPVYVTTIMGYAAYTAVISGFSTFGPTFLLGLGLFKTEGEASLLFGIVVAMAGIIGTPVGGLFLDRANKKLCTKDEPGRLVSATFQMMMMVAIGFGFVLPTAFVLNKVGFLVLLFLGCVLLFATTASVNISILSSVPLRSRSFGLAFSTFFIHAFGDVPSPIVIGALRDSLAPDCGSISVGEGKAELNPKCKDDQHGLHLCLFITAGYLIVGVFFWIVSWLLARRQRAQQQEAAGGEITWVCMANMSATQCTVCSRSRHASDGHDNTMRRSLSKNSRE